MLVSRTETKKKLCIQHFCRFFTTGILIILSWLYTAHLIKWLHHNLSRNCESQYRVTNAIFCTNIRNCWLRVSLLIFIYESEDHSTWKTSNCHWNTQQSVSCIIRKKRISLLVVDFLHSKLTILFCVSTARFIRLV